MTTFLLGQKPSLFGKADLDRKSAAAVIADARRRQRRRRAITAAAVAATGIASVALLALLYVFPSGHQASVRQTSVRLYLSVGATTGETRRVLAAARAEHGVVDARIISKGAALAAMRQQYPALVKHLPINPLPDSIDLRLTGSVDANRLVSDLRAKRLPGIAHVRYITQK
jgi:cell division protein FtsX